MSNTTCREGRQQPPEPPSATSSSEVLQTHEHTLTQGTFSNRIKYQEVGGHVLLLKKQKKKKSTIFKEHLTDTVQQEEH